MTSTFVQSSFEFISPISSHLLANIPMTVRDRDLVSNDHQWEMICEE